MNPRILFLFTLTLLLSACSVRYTHKFRSYILTYLDYQDFALEIGDSGDILITSSNKAWLGGWESKGREKVIYDSLCVLHSDMGYNTVREYIDVPNWGYSFKGDILSIDVVSDADFDEQHPAHSPLNELLRLQAISPYPYIISGYKDIYDWEYNERTQYDELFSYSFVPTDYSYHHLISKNLSKITGSDLILVGSALLTFEHPPTLAKEHKLTVTIRLSDGRVFSPTITKVFTPEPS